MPFSLGSLAESIGHLKDFDHCVLMLCKFYDPCCAGKALVRELLDRTPYRFHYESLLAMDAPMVSKAGQREN